ncbi:MAG: hypothetical protein ABJD11_03675 [Gemmatimonadota bacterium]
MNSRLGGEARRAKEAALILLGISGVATARVSAQQSFEPLAPRVDSMRMTLQRATEMRDIGMQWDETRIIALPGGRVALQRVYRANNSMAGEELDTVVSSVPDLRPMSHHSSGGFLTESLEIGGDTIAGWAETQGQGRRIVHMPIDSLTYDAHTFDLLVRRAPLADNYTFTVQGFLSPDRPPKTLRATVTGSASIPVEAGREVETWVVEVDFGGLSTTLWVEKRGRRLARQTIELGPGVKMVLDRLTRTPGEVRQVRESR